jgi:hypothetical protein
VSTELEDRLRSLSDRLPEPEPQALERVLAGVAGNLRPAPARRRAGSRRWRVAVVGAAAAVAAGAVVGGSLGGGGGVRVDPAAAAVLRRAAITAAHQPALPPLGPGRFYHFRDTELGWVEKADAPHEFSSCSTACPPAPADWVLKARVVSQYWVGIDGSGMVTLSQGPPKFRSAAVRRGFRDEYGLAADRVLGGHSHERFGPGGRTFGWGLSYRQIQHLPSDPARLLALVRAQAAPSSTATHSDSTNSLSFEEFQVVGDMLRASPIKPRVRAAFYTILSKLPGVDFVGRVTDPLGRPGIEVEIQRSSDDLRSILIFDPRTAQLLSEGGGGYAGWSVVSSPGG